MSRSLPISSASDLIASARDPRLVGLFSHGRVRVLLSDLPPEVAQQWEHRVNRLLGDCGCGVGSVFALLTFLAVLLHGTAEAELISMQTAVAVLLGIGASLPAALIGKVAGLWIAKRRYRRAVAGLVDELRRPSVVGSQSG